MPSNIPATTIRIEPEKKRGIRHPRRTRPLHVNACLKALVREGGMPFEMKVAPKKNEK